MTNTNPPTDRLQRMADAKFKEAIAMFPIDELTRNSIEWIHQQSTLHTIKETLTAVEEIVQLSRDNYSLEEDREQYNEILGAIATLKI